MVYLIQGKRFNGTKFWYRFSGDNDPVEYTSEDAAKKKVEELNKEHAYSPSFKLIGLVEIVY